MPSGVGFLRRGPKSSAPYARVPKGHAIGAPGAPWALSKGSRPRIRPDPDPFLARPGCALRSSRSRITAKVRVVHIWQEAEARAQWAVDWGHGRGQTPDTLPGCSEGISDG